MEIFGFELLEQTEKLFSKYNKMLIKNHYVIYKTAREKLYLNQTANSRLTCCFYNFC